MERFIVSGITSARDCFRKHGFCVIRSVLPEDLQRTLRSRFEPLFSGRFNRGVYPDEWHWREGLSLPDATREIVNGWKSDNDVASVVLHEQLGRVAAQLMRWEGSRIAQDDVLFKPAAAKRSSVGYHQDGVYISEQFIPSENNSITCWMPLTDVSETNGTLEYAVGSHLWAKPDVQSNLSEQSFHSSGDYRDPVYRRAALIGIDANNIEFVKIEAPAGSIVLHHQDVWHGSSPNLSGDRPRYAVVAHLLQDGVRFCDDPDYIYGRYKAHDSALVSESFFPILWPESKRSNAIANIPQAPGLNTLRDFL